MTEENEKTTSEVNTVLQKDESASERAFGKPLIRLFVLFFIMCAGICMFFLWKEHGKSGDATIHAGRDLNADDLIPLSLSSAAPAGMIMFGIPEDVSKSDIICENLYNERMLLVHISTKSDSFYGSVSASGVPVDTGKISGDSALVRDVGAFYDRDGAILVFTMSMIYEYTVSVSDDAVTLEAVYPGDMFDRIVVLDPEPDMEAAGATEGISGLCASQLEDSGVRVYVTSSDQGGDAKLPLEALMEETGADMYIRIGVSHDGAGHHGIKAWYDPLYYIPGFGNAELSDYCLRNIVTSCSNKALGIFEAPEDSILYDINVPATYITLGNADDEKELGLLMDEEYRELLAQGLYTAVTDSFTVMGDMKK